MEYGILAMCSVPLIMAGKPVGVLNLYAATLNAFGLLERQLAELLAGRAGQNHRPRRTQAAAGVLSVPSVGDSRGPLVAGKFGDGWAISRADRHARIAVTRDTLRPRPGLARNPVGVADVSGDQPGHRSVRVL